MREAVQHAPPPRDVAYGAAIVFLVKEKSGFLTLAVVHRVANAVLGNLHRPGILRLAPQGKSGIRVTAGEARKPFPLPHGAVTAQVHGADDLPPVLPQDRDKRGQQSVQPTLGAQ